MFEMTNIPVDCETSLKSKQENMQKKIDNKVKYSHIVSSQNYQKLVAQFTAIKVYVEEMIQSIKGIW